jgi:hypothetical protein
MFDSVLIIKKLLSFYSLYYIYFLSVILQLFYNLYYGDVLLCDSVENIYDVAESNNTDGHNIDPIPNPGLLYKIKLKVS